jgi:hypothetical protein
LAGSFAAALTHISIVLRTDVPAAKTSAWTFGGPAWSRRLAGEGQLGRCTAEQTKYYQLYPNSGKLVLAVGYRILKVFGFGKYSTGTGGRYFKIPILESLSLLLRLRLCQLEVKNVLASNGKLLMGRLRTQTASTKTPVPASRHQTKRPVGMALLTYVSPQNRVV